MTTETAAPQGDPTETIGLVVSAALLMLAVLGGATAAFRDEREATTLLANAALILGCLMLRAVVALAQPRRPIRAIGLMLFLASIQPATLIIATILEGDVTYATASTVFSHHDHSVRVALSTFLLFGAATLGACAIGAVDRRSAPDFNVVLSRLGDAELSLLSWVGTAVFVSQFVMLFIEPNVDAGGIVYIVRVVAHALWPATIYVGASLRRGHPMALRQFIAIAAASTFLIIAGNRGTPLSAFICIGFGFVGSSPMSKRRLFTLGGVAAFVLVSGLTAGDVLRNDGGSRTSNDALRRIEELASGQAKQFDADAVRLSTLHRILRNSTHTVISRIPETMPHEADGIAKIPREFADTFLPQIIRQTNYLETLRAGFLREFGYMITENTAVEFAIVGDGWYRAGYAGVLVVGLLLGLFLQLGESYSYRGTTMEQCLKLAVILGTTQVMEGRDIVFGARKMVMAMVIVAVMLRVLRFYRRPINLPGAAAPEVSS